MKKINTQILTKNIISNNLNIKNTIPNYIVYKLCIETAKLLEKEQDSLKNINWTNGEANIDTEYSKLACNCCKLAWDIIKNKYSKYNKIDIICIIPDINITFIIKDDTNIKKKIELKSSKKNKMPGSTIKKLNINQPLIYCLRPKNNSDIYKIRYSQYHNAMGESDIDLFQDRTPRPFINFEKMKCPNEFIPYESKNKNCWIEHYAKCSITRINNPNICKISWQDEMIKKIKTQIIEDYIKNTSIEQISIDKISLEIKKISID